MTNGQLPPAIDIAKLIPDPLANANVNTAISESAQEFPPPFAGGTFMGQTVRGPLLPPYGTKQRDAALRLIFRDNYNTIFASAVAGIIKRLQATPFEIIGPDAIAKHYQSVLNNAEFGKGWSVFLSKLVMDYLTQDFGGIVELIGDGDPIEPLTGRVVGIAHLDAGRCLVTGNPYYPVNYWSLYSGSLHRMHSSRIYRLIDMPNPDERFFDLGFCALSRAIAPVDRQILMGKYIHTQLDDKPSPGINLFTGILEPQWTNALQRYLGKLENDEQDPFGRTLNLFSINPDNKLEIQSIGFSVPPDKFNYIEYNSLDVDAIAAALNIDRQEIWQLQGGNIGSAAQSKVLAEKARGRLFGLLLQEIERFINNAVLPESCEFSFKYQDETAQREQADYNSTVASTALSLATATSADGKPVMSSIEAREYMANNSPQLKDVLTDDAGQVIPPQAVAPPTDKVALEDDNPIDVSAVAAQPSAPEAVAASENVAVEPQSTSAVKAFSVTAADFRRQFVDAVQRALQGRIERNQFETRMLDLLTVSVTKSFADGRRDGGLLTPLDEFDRQDIETYMLNQIDYIDGLASEVYGGSFPAGQLQLRADMWVNKSLQGAYNEGKITADKNGMYKWVLGDTQEHCRDCPRLNGQVHRYKEWYSRGWVPRGENTRTECQGFNCKCQLVPTNEEARGRF